MNFLIISLARCGSSSLQKSIANYYNSNIIFEPYAAWGLQRKKYKINNVVVKTILHQIDNKDYSFGELPTSHFEKCIEFYSDLTKKFDKVILLGRKNIYEHAESLFALYNGVPFNVKYVYKDGNNIQPFVDRLKIENEYLQKLSDKIKIPIDTYEELYYGKGLQDKSICLDSLIIDNKNKLRQFVQKDNKSLI